VSAGAYTRYQLIVTLRSWSIHTFSDNFSDNWLPLWSCATASESTHDMMPGACLCVRGVIEITLHFCLTLYCGCLAVRARRTRLLSGPRKTPQKTSTKVPSPHANLAKYDRQTRLAKPGEKFRCKEKCPKIA